MKRFLVTMIIILAATTAHATTKQKQPKPIEARLDSILCVMDSETTVTLNVPSPLNWTDAHREQEAEIICDSLKITKRQEN